jgi:hypothetical protein
VRAVNRNRTRPEKDKRTRNSVFIAAILPREYEDPMKKRTIIFHRFFIVP